MRFPLSSALCTALAVALAGCTPPPPVPASGADEERPAQAQPADAPGQGTVTIADDDAAADIQQWTPPRVDRQQRSQAQLRRAAGQAFARDHLNEGAEAASPVWLAVQEVDPDGRQARAGLQRARQRLLDRRGLGVRFGAEAGRAAAEALRVGPELGMGLDADHDLAAADDRAGVHRGAPAAPPRPAAPRL